MKKTILAIYILTFALCFGGCTTKESNSVDTITHPTSSENTTVPFVHGEVIKLYESTALIAEINKENSLYMVGLNIPIYNADMIKTGDIVDIGYNGSVMETYPAQLGEPKFINVVDSKKSLVSFYEKVFLDLWNTDKGLNSDINVIAVDLSKVENLKEYEKNALLYVLWNNLGYETIDKTYEELCSEGYIDTENLYFENGILFSVETSDVTESSFKFNASKWRSGLGAYFFNDCQAEINDGKLSYTIGSEAIS